VSPAIAIDVVPGRKLLIQEYELLVLALGMVRSVRKLQFPLNRLKARLVAQRVQERIGFQLN
jgi:hypothetical protein